MVPMQPTVTEEQEAKNKAYKSLDNTVVEVDEDDSGNPQIIFIFVSFSYFDLLIH